MSGNPVREAFLAIGPRPVTGGERRVLVFGGSQGAHAINQAMVAAAAHIREIPGTCAIVHQTGERDFEAVKAGYAAAGVTADVPAFISDMPQQMAEADVVVCRAGATTLAELTAAGRVGNPDSRSRCATDDHQRANARTLEAAGAAVMLDETDLTGERLAAELARLLGDERTAPGDGDAGPWPGSAGRRRRHCRARRSR